MQLKRNARLFEAEISSFAVGSHNNKTELEVLVIAMNKCRNIEVDNPATEWIGWGNPICRQNITVLGKNLILFR